jgi:hypothetical protein
MQSDRYVKMVLTVIAAALVYLCVLATPLPVVDAQTAKRPGDPTGPAEVVVIGWRAPASHIVPVTTPAPLRVDVLNTVRVQGQVTTERSAGRADRVVLVGWEEVADRDRSGVLRPLDSTAGRASLPVSVVAR